MRFVLPAPQVVEYKIPHPTDNANNNKETQSAKDGHDGSFEGSTDAPAPPQTSQVVPELRVITCHPDNSSNHVPLLPLSARPLFELGGVTPWARAFLPSNDMSPLPTAPANNGTPQRSKARPFFQLGGFNPEADAILPSITMPPLLTARANDGTPQTRNVGNASKRTIS